VGDGLGASEPRGQGGAAGSSSREAEELKASIISVTQREKDRVEGLQAQLEMIRIELKVNRYVHTLRAVIPPDLMPRATSLVFTTK
jgi:shikimate 5-dehydrogenase